MLRVMNVLNSIGFTTIPVQLSEYIVKDCDVEVDNRILNYRSWLGNFQTIKNLSRFDIIHTHHTFSGLVISFFYCLMAIVSRKPVFFHTLHRNYKSLSVVHRFLYGFFLLPLRDRIIVNSLATFDSIPNFVKRLIRNKVFLIYNGVDTQKKYRKLVQRKNINTFRIVNVARMVAIKNQKTIIDAFKLIIDKGFKAELVFYGDGPEMENLKGLVKDYDLLEMVVFHGIVPRKEVIDALQDVDISITASWNEGFGVATIEAVVAGVLVLASDLPVHREILGDSDLLFDPNDYISIANKIEHFMLDETDLSCKVLNTKSICSKFDIRKTAYCHEQLYRESLQEKFDTSAIKPLK